MTDLTSIYAPVATELDRVQALLSKDLVSDESPAASILAEVDRVGGKLLRPALVLLSGRASGRLSDHHIRAAAAIELIHRASLLHDDVLDGAKVRRNRPTTNALWGNAVPILAGDILLSHVFRLVVSLPEPRVFPVYADAICRTCEGEIRQLFWSGNLSITEPECLRIAEEKTASLWAAACEVGALLGCSSEHDVALLKAYGTNLGTAFQIADDCLDLIGSEQQSGKTLGTDLAKGHYTLPLVHLLSAAPAEARELLNGSPLPLEIRAARLRASLTTHGSLDYAVRRAAHLAQEAADPLDRLPASAARDCLAELAGRLVSGLAGQPASPALP